MSELPKSMHAWRKHKPNREPVWESVPVPPCPRQGYLVKLLASGVCHSDEGLLNRTTNHPPGCQDVYTLGHEGCGEIVEVGVDVGDGKAGADVPDVVHRVGDRVALLSMPGCGRVEECEDCRRGVPQCCYKGLSHGLGNDGFYAPYVAVDRRVAVAVPDGVSSEVAAVATDAVLTSYHGIMRRAEVKKHETVFLFGLGGLGFNALQIVVNGIGARVIVSDIREQNLQEAVKLGVSPDDVVPVGKSVQEFVTENKLYNKIDKVLDFVGTQQTMTDAGVIVRQGGTVLCVGLLNYQNTIFTPVAMRKRLTYLYTYGGQYRDLAECLDWIAKGIITPRVETKGLQDFPQVLKDLSEGRVKARIALMHDASAGSHL